MLIFLNISIFVSFDTRNPASIFICYHCNIAIMKLGQCMYSYVSCFYVNLSYLVYLLNKVFSLSSTFLLKYFTLTFKQPCAALHMSQDMFSVPFHWITLMLNHRQLCVLFNFYIYTYVETFNKVYSFPRQNWLRRGTELIIDIYFGEHFVKVYD